MNRVGILLKNELLIYKNRLSKLSKSKKGGMSLVYILAFLILFYSLYMQSDVLIQQLLGSGLERFALDQQILTILLLNFILLIGNSLMLKEKDSDFLLSLPVTKKEIILSKILFKYLIDFVLMVAFYYPTLILYFIKVDNNILILLNGLLVTLILPIFFVGLEYILNSIINVIAIRFKRFNLIKVLLSIVEVFGLIGLYYLATFNMLNEDGTFNHILIISDITDVVVNNDYLKFILLVIISILTLSVGVYIYQKLYGKQVKTFKNNDKVLRHKKANSQLIAMIKKEFKTYFSSTAYLFNTIVGYMMLIAASIAIFFIDMDKTILTLIAYGIVSFSLSTCCTSNSSISLEGKNFWIYKSAPIDYKKILYAKALMNFILIFVTGFVSILLVLISNKLDLLTVLLLFVLLLANGLLLSFVGVFVNLLFPKLDYENETQVVKQSLSVTVSMFSFMILFMIFPAIYFFLSMEEIVLDMNLLIGLNIIVSLIIFSLALILINKKAEGLIKKL